MNTGACALCAADGGLLLWQDAHWRVVRALGAEVEPAPDGAMMSEGNTRP
jgi:hypothetical protein